MLDCSYHFHLITCFDSFQLSRVILWPFYIKYFKFCVSNNENCLIVLCIHIVCFETSTLNSFRYSQSLLISSLVHSMFFSLSLFFTLFFFSLCFSPPLSPIKLSEFTECCQYFPKENSPSLCSSPQLAIPFQLRAQLHDHFTLHSGILSAVFIRSITLL